MIGAGLRLAGRGLGMLFKPGVGGQIARGVAGTGAVMAAPSVVSTAQSGVGDVQDRILSEQANKLSTEDYKIGIGDQFRGGLNQALGAIGIGDGSGITQDSLSARKSQRDLDTLNKDSEFVQQLKRADYIPQLGDTKAKLTAKFGKKIRENKAADELQAAITQAAGLSEYNRSTPEYKREMRLADEDRSIRNQSAIDARNDQLLARQQSLDLGMAQLNSQSARDNREFDYQDRVLDYNMKAKKAERMQKIAMALGALPGLFGI